MLWKWHIRPETEAFYWLAQDKIISRVLRFWHLLIISEELPCDNFSEIHKNFHEIMCTRKRTAKQQALLCIAKDRWLLSESPVTILRPRSTIKAGKQGIKVSPRFRKNK